VNGTLRAFKTLNVPFTDFGEKILGRGVEVGRGGST